MRKQLHWARVCGVFAMAGLVNSAFAQPVSEATAPEVVVPRDERAREIFREGREAFLVGDFRVAAARFERAFELSGRPILLVNIASALEALGDRDRALAALQQFLLLDPGSSQRTVIAERIQHLGGIVPASRARLTSSPQVAEGEAPRTDRTLTWIAAVLAGSAMTASGVLFVDAVARYESLRSGCSSTGCPNDAVDGVSTRATAAWALAGTGVGLAVLSVVLFFVQGSTDTELPPSPAPLVEVGPGSVSLRGTW